uniref:Uncharacterized protein n=1 Tax=Electrophorus electricus TaxID=8005 RepID=A0AAY5F1R6_ELEEL
AILTTLPEEVITHPESLHSNNGARFSKQALCEAEIQRQLKEKILPGYVSIV